MATHRMAEDNTGLIWHVLNTKFPFLLTDPDRASDAYSAGYMELLGAAERYTPERGRKFSTYAVRCIWGGVHRFLWEERRQNRLPCDSLDRPLTEEEGSATLGDMVAAPLAADPAQLVPGQEGFAELLAALSPRQQTVIVALYAEGRTGEEVAQASGITRQMVYNITRAALLRLERLPRWKEASTGETLTQK